MTLAIGDMRAARPSALRRRITLERWGGGIGYERRPEGGSRFWIRLVDALRRKRHG